MADATDSKSVARKGVRVQLSPPVLASRRRREPRGPESTLAGGQVRLLLALLSSFLYIVDMDMQADELSRIVGKNVRRFRTARNLTQTELAGLAKMPQGHLSALENGKRSPNLSTIAEIAEALGVEPVSLLLGEIPISS